jgi:hypothetical protein
MNDEGIKNSNFYGVTFYYSPYELMQIEARRTKIQELKRLMGNKYLLAPLYGRINDGQDRTGKSGMVRTSARKNNS